MNRVNPNYIELSCSLPEREWYKDIKAKALYLHLLLRAGSAPGAWQGAPLKAGQLISSLDALGKECGLSFQETRSAVKRLEESGELFVRSLGQGRRTLFELADSSDCWRGSTKFATKFATKFPTKFDRHSELGFCWENEGEPTKFATKFPTNYASSPENEAEKQAGEENIYNIYSSSSVGESIKNLDNNIYITPSVTESINKKKNIPPFICPPKGSEAENECENSTKDSAAPGKAKGKSALKPPSREELIAVIRACTANEEVQEAAIGWLDMRINKKAAPTERAIHLAFAEVRRATQDADVAVAMFDRSTLNGWKGVFPLEGSGK